MNGFSAKAGAQNRRAETMTFSGYPAKRSLTLPSRWNGTLHRLNVRAIKIISMLL
jgi:hypothetical protein